MPSSSFYQNAEFTSCYSHWKITPRPSQANKKSGRYTQSSMEAFQHLQDRNVSKLTEELVPHGPKLPKLKKKKHGKEKKAHLINMLAASVGCPSSPNSAPVENSQVKNEMAEIKNENHSVVTSESCESSNNSCYPKELQINFTEVVINSVEDLKKVPKEHMKCSINMLKKPSIWNTIPRLSSVPVSSLDDYHEGSSSVLLQQILKEEKKFDEAVQQQTCAALESINSSGFAHSTLNTYQSSPLVSPQPINSRYRNSGIAFPLSRIPSLEKLQFNMQGLGQSTTAGHNFSAFMPNDINVFQNNSFISNERLNSVPVNEVEKQQFSTTHIPLSKGRTTSLEKFLSYWQGCTDPMETNVQKYQPISTQSQLSQVLKTEKQEEICISEFSPLENLCLEDSNRSCMNVEAPNFEELLSQESETSPNSSNCSTPEFSDFLDDFTSSNFGGEKNPNFGNEAIDHNCDFFFSCQKNDEMHSQDDIHFVEQVFAF